MTKLTSKLIMVCAVFMLLGTVFSSQDVTAAIYSSVPDADAQGTASVPSSSNGSGLNITSGWHGATVGEWGFVDRLRWNLPGDLAGATINSATLTVPLRFGINNDLAATAADAELQAYTQNWSEATSSWDNYETGNAWPGGDGGGGSSDRVQDGGANKAYDTQTIPVAGYVSEVTPAATVVFDAKTLIEYWAGGGANEGLGFGMPVNTNGGGNQFFNFWSRENSNGLAPVLAIDYTVAAIPEPTSVILLGLGGLALVLRRRRS